MRSEWAAELAELKADVEHKRRHAAAAIKARQEDQDVQVGAMTAAVPATAAALCPSLCACCAVACTASIDKANYQCKERVCASSWVLYTPVPLHLLWPRHQQALEFSAQQRLWALQQHELSAIGSSALQDAAAAQAALISAERQRKEQEWRAQDELRTLRRQQETLRRTSLVAAAEQEAARQQAAGLLLTRELQARQELEQVRFMGCV